MRTSSFWASALVALTVLGACAKAPPDAIDPGADVPVVDIPYFDDTPFDAPAPDVP